MDTQKIMFSMETNKQTKKSSSLTEIYAYINEFFIKFFFFCSSTFIIVIIILCVYVCITPGGRAIVMKKKNFFGNCPLVIIIINIFRRINFIYLYIQIQIQIQMFVMMENNRSVFFSIYNLYNDLRLLILLKWIDSR